ncbi:MAG: thioredoxin domain-containing protein [Candidatus Binatia bacterium]
MSKASRKAAAQAPLYPDPPPWAGRALLVAAIAGIVFSAISTYIHLRLRWSGGLYTSFCNISQNVNCDDVVTSPYGSLFGVPVSAWGLAFYALLAFVAVRSSGMRSPARNRARADALALAIGGAAFSLYLGLVSLLILETVCVLCAGLYVVSVVALVSAIALAAPISRAIEQLKERWQQVRERPAMATIAAATVVAVLVLPSWLGAPTRLTREEVFKANPGFYDWFTALPIVETPTAGGVSAGKPDAKVTLIEFSDFQCPHCRMAHVMLKDVLPRFGDDVRFVFYNYPLSKDCNDAMPGRGHEHACKAAAAAICADEQGQFKRYSDLMFARQDALEPEKLRDYAEETGLDLSAWDKCTASAETAARITADVAAGQRSGVVSTPTFFMNGRKIEGNMPFENWLMGLAVELDKGA